MLLWLQWSSIVFQLCKLTLDRHRVQASASVVCSGIPVYLWLQWSSSVVCPVVSQCTDIIWIGGSWIRSIPSMQPIMYTTGVVRVVWVKLISFELSPQIYKDCDGAYIKSMHRVMHVLRAALVSIAERQTPSKGWIYRAETCPFAHWRPVILSFETGMDATMLNYMCLGVCGLLPF